MKHKTSELEGAPLKDTGSGYPMYDLGHQAGDAMTELRQTLQTMSALQHLTPGDRRNLARETLRQMISALGGDENVAYREHEYATVYVLCLLIDQKPPEAG